MNPSHWSSPVGWDGKGMGGEALSRTGPERSRYNGQASFANIYVLNKYTRRITKNKKDSYVRRPMYLPTFFFLAFSITSKNTCLLEKHIASKIPVIEF